ncbi:hypothetical protein TA3x_003240 [Tundrisphaera sp. TA3]|uniref:hypothetical protein n=1 Tax=Tundrisphaera sp. TA3 TaxID=3435775 RepID=UPI003EBE350B
MDQGKMKTPRARRTASSPSLEPLEGRRLMAARAAASVGFSEVAGDGFTSLVITGTNKADVINISDDGTGEAGNLSITLGNGTTYTSKAGIQVIQVLGKKGNDKISYSLDGDLVKSQIVLVDGSAGNDRFTANINGNVNNSAGLDVECYGGAGNDTMVVNQRGAILQGSLISYLQGDAGNDKLTFNGSGPVAQGASIVPEFSGGAGNDKITTEYSGVIQGNFIYNLTVDGGAGNDNIVTNINVAAGSTGSVGSGSALPAAVQGGAGNDKIRYTVRLAPSVTNFAVNAVVIGNKGRDQITRTANVEGDPTNEKESLIA